jgi:hypothetical protein
LLGNPDLNEQRMEGRPGQHRKAAKIAEHRSTG